MRPEELQRLAARGAAALLPALARAARALAAGALRAARAALRRGGGAALSHRGQGALLAANALLAAAAARRLRRARFAMGVRLVRDLRAARDLQYLIGHLPPWVANSEWERAGALQTALSLIWPSLNTWLCEIIKRELEERLQGDAQTGRLVFSRFSFGRHPPTVAGIKAAAHGAAGGDAAAMVLDLDVRWAGEPDVVMRLAAAGGARVGVRTAQVRGVLRLVLAPVTDEPPFVRRIAISLLERPFIDFDLVVLGGADLMSLPAVSGWLHAAVAGITAHHLLWPREQQVWLGPPPGGADGEGGGGGGGEGARPPPPLGVLTLEVLTADVEPRRSTFVGRLKKAVNPRVFALLPTAGLGGGGGGDDAPAAPADAGGGVLQASLTPAAHATLRPCWRQRFAFVVTSRRQVLRLLLSHRRMNRLLGADMPLGEVEIPLAEVLPPATGAAAAAAADAEAAARADGDATAAAQLAAKLAAAAPAGAAARGGAAAADSPPVTPRPWEDARDDAPFLTPTASLARSSSLPGGGGGGAWSATPSPSGSRRWTPEPDWRGAGAGGDSPSRSRLRSPTPAWLTPQGAAAVDAAPRAHPCSPAHCGGGAGGRRGASPPAPRGSEAWLAPGGAWVDLPATSAVTLAGMVAGAVQGGRPAADEAEGGSWLGALFGALGSLAAQGERSDDDDDDGAGGEGSDLEGGSPHGGGPGARHASAGRLLVRLAWTPAAPPAPPAPAPRPSADGGGGGEATPARRSSADGRGGAGDAPPTSARKGKPGRGGRASTDGGAEPAAPPPGGASPPPAPPAPPGGASPPPPRGRAPSLELPRPGPGGALAGAAGVLGVRVAWTKLEYGQTLGYPVLALSLEPAAPPPPPAAAGGGGRGGGAPAPAGHSAAARLISMDCSPGGRPGLLHWNRVFYLPVLPGGGGALPPGGGGVADARLRVELGDAASSIRLTSFGASLYCLDAAVPGAFERSVRVAAAAGVPLREAAGGRAAWRLREAARPAGGDALDVGRVSLRLAWFPLA